MYLRERILASAMELFIDKANKFIGIIDLILRYAGYILNVAKE